MDEEELKTKIREDLTNFPEEIVEEWVLGHHRRWPPEDVSNCGPVFLFKSLDFWKNVSWNLIDMEVSDFSFSDDPDNAIYAIAGSFSFDTEDPSSIFREITSERSIEILSYILEHGEFPKPPCLLSQDGNYEIADGHHRLYALRVATAVDNKLKEMNESSNVEFDSLLKEVWNIKSRTRPQSNQKVWLAAVN